MTKYLTPVNVKLGKKVYYLLDTPGFEDTEGPIIDIINGHGVIKALKKAKSVRIVIVMSSKSMGKRLDKLADLT